MGWRKWIAVGVGAGRHWPQPASIFRPDRAIRVATGVVAHNVCSKTFVSGLDPQTVFSETTERDGTAPLAPVLVFQVDRTGESGRGLGGGTVPQPRCLS